MVVYNLGQQDIIVKDSSVRVNDGKYHVVRFTRDGINSSLQVDDNKVSDIEIDLISRLLERFTHIDAFPRSPQGMPANELS